MDEAHRAGPKPEMGAARPALVERERELAAIADELGRAERGEGATVLIEGPMGCGKSALLRAAINGENAAGFEVLRASGREIERGFAFGVVIELFAPLLESLSEPERRELFSGAAALARPLFESAGEDSAPGEVFPRLHGLHWLCANLSARRPLLLVVDDAHWCDEASLSFLAYLAARVGELSLCLVTAVRDRETDAGTELGQGLRRERATVIELAPLSEAGVGRLLVSWLDRDDEALAGECARATGGNPLFLRELLREIRAQNGIAAEAVGKMAPQEIGRNVLDRIAAMPAEDARVIRAMAVLGDGTDLRLVSRLARVERGRLGGSVDRLVEGGLLDPDAPLGFAHPIVRQAIYAAIAPAARSRSHLEAAQTLAMDPQTRERAAAHMLKVELRIEPPGAEVIEALVLAARRARQRGAAEQGTRFLERALAEELEPDLRRKLLLEVGIEGLRLGRTESVEQLREAESLAEDGDSRAEAALALCTAQMQTGALGDAIETCDRALASLDSGREMRLFLEAQRANARWVAGTMTAAELERLRSLDAEVGRTPAERAVLTILAAGAAGTASRSAANVKEVAERALGDGALLADLGAEHPSYTSAVAALTLSGHLAVANAEWSKGVADSRRRGSLVGYASALFSRSYSRYLAGDLAGAEADAVEGLELLPESGLISRPFPTATLALVAIERAEVGPEAERDLELLLADGATPQVATFSYASLASARLALARDDAELALTRYLDTGRRAKMTGWVGPWTLPWRSGAARALGSLGRAEEAQELLEEELELARAYEAPAAIGIALHAKADVAGEGEEIEILREAVEALGTSEAALDHALALIGLGAAVRRSGARRECREPLREGMDLAQRCGSRAGVERALHELRASGARPRRPAIRGAEALSPQERQTARRAAEGLSNREIAEAMFLTRRTIEMHLSGAYRKLGISSRDELAAALAEGSPPPPFAS